MNSYIVRIYRRDSVTHEIAGIVEPAESQGRVAFKDFAGLREILKADSTQASAGERIQEALEKKNV